MRFSSRGPMMLVGILLAICLGVSIAVGCSFIISPAPRATVEWVTPTLAETRAPTAIPTESKTSTPAPTFTLVIQPGTPLPPLGLSRSAPTPSLPYGIAAITPIVLLMKNPIGFASPFRVVTYPVTGSTVDQLSESLDQNAMRDPHDSLGRYFAQTSWFLSATWDEKPTFAGCEVARAAVTITITMTLPVINNPSNLPPEVAKRWDNFIASTITHEMGHVKLTLDGATEYRRELGNYLPAISCDLLKRRLNDSFKKEYTQIDNANVDYDSQTNHGVNQGAVFP